MTDFTELIREHNRLQAEFYSLRIEFNEKLLIFRAFIDEANDFLQKARTLPALFNTTVITPVIKLDPVFIRESANFLLRNYFSATGIKGWPIPGPDAR